MISFDMVVHSDIIKSLYYKQQCAVLVIDVSKGFDTVDHIMLLKRLVSIGLSKQTGWWFENYLSGQSQCAQGGGITSNLLSVSKGVVPRGLVLGPPAFTVIYCSTSTQKHALCQLATYVKRVLNADKKKLIMFPNATSKSLTLPSITTSHGSKTQPVYSYSSHGGLLLYSYIHA